MAKKDCFCGWWLEKHRCRHCRRVMSICYCDATELCKELAPPP
jgi:hypothetical protein